jgi:hypothetical protein
VRTMPTTAMTTLMRVMVVCLDQEDSFAGLDVDDDSDSIGNGEAGAACTPSRNPAQMRLIIERMRNIVTLFRGIVR